MLFKLESLFLKSSNQFRPFLSFKEFIPSCISLNICFLLLCSKKSKSDILVHDWMVQSSFVTQHLRKMGSFHIDTKQGESVQIVDSLGGSSPNTWIIGVASTALPYQCRGAQYINCDQSVDCKGSLSRSHRIQKKKKYIK